MEFFATCPTGFEQLLAQELRNLGMEAVRPLQGQVSFAGTPEKAMEACLWSRLASRIVLVLARAGASTSDELYASLSDVAWEEHLLPTKTFAVDASGTNAELRTTQFVALRAKDAIVDRLQEAVGTRPAIDAKQPDLRVVVRISRNRAVVGIDFAGEPLFRRGYERDRRGFRPDYAAAMLAMGAWEEAGPGALLLDVHSEQGTMLVEAASIAARQAPGLLRTRWGFEGWAGYDPQAWQTSLERARSVFVEAPDVRLAAFDGKQTALNRALRTAGIAAEVQVVRQGDVSALGIPALLTCDLIDASDEPATQASLVSRLVHATTETKPQHIVTLSRDALPGLALNATAERTVTTRLGRDTALFSAFGPLPDTPRNQIVLPNADPITPLVAASDQFAARLKKVARQRARWAKREDVTCYRVYDADLPDYALTIDLFQGCDPRTMMPTGKRWLQVSEFAPPKDVDPALARCRLLDALTIAPVILDVDPRNVFVRVRRHAKGGSQYADEATPFSANNRSSRRRQSGPILPPGAHLIEEGGLIFEVNFSQRLDCGIFLDHRDTRSMLREMAKQTKGSKRFLNLFAYTGTATCYAADGGMIHTTTVDLSRPSLDWARRNMERNGFAGREHEYVQADVISWIGEQRHTRNRWDLIFCDVPTFSNSSRMRNRSFDVQRDHSELLIGLSRLLTRDGICVFSCNLRTFAPDEDKLKRARVEIEDITAQTIPEDFARNKRIHHAYLVRRA
ncbi:MAG: bifunctional 23S rRNA (guanine(2069)-N(7))-methyltransferase RlmK/23S rRNA (guanine(2445)-N(2))-methyltransferase RlmL [Atopobiaceae bacterium]|nr:bifunctional 23S rRNA (guanine(2069)-N(7))-methyltransferase RlmK/23S rRNA (guanine(2445)-N(2))-methyltransferase RlmL [Atopobiaceae bacterium]MBR3312735.1 bifunctional 23S rRNA (guanine(2069)-N(7))-methyltransferase RlmK/23S rRNA (guanine(2445)-N(2))-methyltransferase RlmL [Atopobiaceae bacterium]